MKVVATALVSLVCLFASDDSAPQFQVRMETGPIEVDFSPLQLIGDARGYKFKLVVTAEDGQKTNCDITTTGPASPEGIWQSVTLCLQADWIIKDGKEGVTLVITARKTGSPVKDCKVSVEGIPKKHTPEVRRIPAQATKK